MEPAHHQALVGVDERRAEGGGGGGGGVCVCVLMPVKAAEQKEKAMNSSPVCLLTDQEVSHFFDSVNK